MSGSGWILPIKAKYGVAVYNYRSELEHHLNLSVGDTIHITEEYEGTWYKGFVILNTAVKGVFPASYIHLKEAIVERRSKKESIIPTDLPIVHEVTHILREWGVIWKKMFQRNQITTVFHNVRTMMRELIEMRKRVVSGTLPADELRKISYQVADLVDYGNSILNLDLNIRNEKTCQPADIRNLSAVEVFRMHETAAKKVDKRKEKDTMEESGRELTVESSHETRKSHVISLFVSIKNFVCRIGEDADVFMALFDGKESTFLSENYFVRWGSQGLPKNIDMLNNLNAVFTDLGSKDLSREKIYLVCKIVRKGRMELKDTDNKKMTLNLRRAFGAAVMDITGILRRTEDNNEDKQHFIPFVQVSGENESLHQTIVRAIASRGEINHKGQGLWVSMKMLDGDLKTIRRDFQHLVDRSSAVVRKMGFPEIIMPDDVRNDLYVTIVQGEFDRGGKASQKNVEVTMCVCNDKGAMIPIVVSMGSGEDPENQYRSHIYYQNKTPKWNETVKVQIPIEDFYNAHLRFTFRHRSTMESKDKAEREFGLSYVKLMRKEGTTLQDGAHNLLVYKIETRQIEPNDSKRYLSLPSTKEEMEVNGKAKVGASPSHPRPHHGPKVEGFSLSSRDSFQISTLVCSTKLTQNIDLLGLLKWKAQPKNLAKKLQALVKVDGEEIVKFLQDTLDALFNILMESGQDSLVFNALVYIISLTAEKKFSHFRDVLDSYVDQHFSATLAYEKLTKVLISYLKKAEKNSEEFREPLLKALKALEYLFKFIVKSRILFQQFDDKEAQSFEEGIRDIFKSINNLMSISADPALQAFALKCVPSVIKDTVTVFEPKELSLLLLELIQNVPAERLIKQKLQCMLEIVHSDIFKMKDCRLILLKMVTLYLKDLMEKEEELETCGLLLGDVLTLLATNSDSTKGDIQEMTNVLLRTVIRVVIKQDRQSQLAGNYVACMISILRQMQDYHYEAFISGFPNKYDLTDFLMEIFTMFQDLINNNVYRQDWITMLSLQNLTLMKSIKFFTKTLNSLYLDEESFQYQIWSNFFHLAVAFLTQKSLRMEIFSHNKRQSMIKKYGDLRTQMGFEIRAMWFNLGPHKLKFIPDMVGPVLEMTLIPETDLRRATIPIFFDMMQCELHSTGSFRMFESEMITKLDVLIEAGRGDVEYQKIFHQIMTEWCSKHQYLRATGIEFVNLVEKLLGRLFDYREIIRDENRDNRMSCTVNLLNFYKDIGRLEMYVRYFYKLCDLHLECDNYTEAAFTLLQHAKVLEWSDELLTTQHSRYKDAMTQRELKEALYYDIIDLFQRGKMWEQGIKLCKELATQHETETFRYQQLSDILFRQADLYKNITSSIRPEPEYFFVGYYGQAFPTFQRNRTFIFRGKEYERLDDFTTRTLNQLPNAQRMNTTAPPGDDILNSNSMYVQVYTVSPIMEEPPHFKGKSVDDQILNFYKVNNVQRFQYSKPFRKGPKDKDNEFASMWIERYTFTTSYKLPGILRWFEIKDTVKKEISPLENAVETMESANAGLRRMIMRYHKNPDEPINPLSMKLNGVVDPRVMGGFANYEKAFFTETYTRDNPQDQAMISNLKDLISIQIPLLKEGVKLHGEMAPPSLQPFHQNMVTCFRELKANVEKKYGKRPPFSSGLSFRRSTKRRLNLPEPRRKSLLSIHSMNSDLSPRTPPEVPSKKSGSRITSAVLRSASLALSSDKSGGRRSNTSEWFVNFGSTTSLDKSVSSLSSSSGVTGNSTVELREELTVQRPRRPKSQVGLPLGLSPKLSPMRESTRDGERISTAPPLPMKQYGDYGNLPNDPDVMKKHEMSRGSIGGTPNKPPLALPLKKPEDSPNMKTALPPKKPKAPK